MGCGLSRDTSFTTRKERHWKERIGPHAAHGSSQRDRASRQLDHGEGSRLVATADSPPNTCRAPPTEIGGPTRRPFPSASDSPFGQHRFPDGPTRLLHAYREEYLAGAGRVVSMQCTVLTEYSSVDDFDAMGKPLCVENLSRSYASHANTPRYESVRSTDTEGTTLWGLPEKTSGRPPCAASGAAATLTPSAVAPAERAVGREAAAKGPKASACGKEPIQSAAKLGASPSSSPGVDRALAPPAQFMGGGRGRNKSPAAPETSTSPVVNALAMVDASLRSTAAGQRWASRSLSVGWSGTAFDTAADSVECTADVFLTGERNPSDTMRTVQGSAGPCGPLSADSTRSEKAKGVMSGAPAIRSGTDSIGSPPSTQRKHSAPLGDSLIPVNSPALTNTGSLERVSRKSRQSAESPCRSVPLYPRNCSRGGWGQSIDSCTGAVASQDVCDSGESARDSFCAYSSDDMDTFCTRGEDVVMRGAREANISSLCSTPQVHRVRHSSCSVELCNTFNERDNTKSTASEDDDDSCPGNLARKTSANSDVVVGSAMSLLRVFAATRKERRRIVKIVEPAALPALETKMPANPILMTKSVFDDHPCAPPEKPPMLAQQHRQGLLHCMPLTERLRHTQAASAPPFTSTGSPVATQNDDTSPEQPFASLGRRRVVTRANRLPRTFGDS
ncbi:hypothetical protein JIQ42_02838 [Leishmania sp. Namibia]|uniref:hypothetical protein n=1 Tax=Leishmania sp. Namibia TaxID=2802991 RepID=UPI001B47A352|nr:hypothetical protein JIQ42_02838 [Leishmania sp. Namibia]